MITLIIILLPILLLLLRIIIILNKNLWINIPCKIENYKIIKKQYGTFAKSIEDAPDNYLCVEYSYTINGAKFLSNRISLDLVSRGYRPIEIEYDNFIKKIKDNNCNAYYFKYLKKLSVIDLKSYHALSSLALLMIYAFVVISSYFIIIYISK